MNIKQIIKSVRSALKKHNNVILGMFVAASLFLVYRFFTGKSLCEGNNAKKLIFVHMNGCGHCVKFKPVWDKVAVDNPTSIKMEYIEAKDATELRDSKGEPLTSFPAVILTGGASVIDYNGERTEDALKSFLKKHDK